VKEEKLTFWKRICISVKNIENFRVISEDKTHLTIIYLLLLLIIFTTVVSTAIFFRFDGSLLDSEKYIINIILENNNTESLNTIIESINQSRIINYIVIYISIFVFYLFSTLLDSISLSIMGFLVCKITKFRMTLKQLYNVAVHCLTLSIILSMIYILLNLFTGFKIIHFSIMYTIIACIYLIAAILIIRDDINKRNIELMKIIEEQARVRLEIKKRELEKKEQEEKERVKQKDRKKKEQDKEDKESEVDSAPEGNNA